MIVPRSHLLFWVGIVGVPAATVGVMLPSATVPSAVLIVGFLALVLLDALLALGSLDSVRVECPQVVRLSKDREGSIDVCLQNDRNKPVRLRLGLVLPPEILTHHEDLLTLLPQKSELLRFSWPCTAFKRGQYHLHQCVLESSSPLNLWAWRTRKPLQTEIRIYPNLLSERKNLAAFFLNKGGSGIHAQRLIGKGREFEKLREYIPGDTYEDIHWKATAKRGHPITKVFQVERTQEVYVIIDASRLSARKTEDGRQRTEDGRRWTEDGRQRTEDGGQRTGDSEDRYGESSDYRPPSSVFRPLPSALRPPSSVLERFVTGALIMGQAAERQGDLFGTLVFSDKVQQFVRAGSGKAHYGVCRDGLYTLQPQEVTPDFNDLCSFIGSRLRRRALLVFLTNLDDPVIAESFVRNMDLVCRRHLVLVNMMRPTGAKPLFSDASASSVDDLYGYLGGHILWSGLREVEKVLQKRGARLSLLDNEKMCVELVSQYLDVKQRQLL